MGLQAGESTKWASSQGFFLHGNTTEDTMCPEDDKYTRERKRASAWMAQFIHDASALIAQSPPKGPTSKPTSILETLFPTHEM